MKDGNKKIARLVGAGPLQRGRSLSDLPRASAEEIDAVIDLAKTLSSEEIAARLNISRETVNAWRKEGRLLGVESAKRGLRYPADQLGPNDAPLPLADIVRELDGDHWAAWRFLAMPVHELGAATGFELLRAGKLGDLKAVLEGRAYGAFS
jgi:DNA-binding CsgD family transcriptional regulator